MVFCTRDGVFALETVPCYFWVGSIVKKSGFDRQEERWSTISAQSESPEGVNSIIETYTRRFANWRFIVGLVILALATAACGSTASTTTTVESAGPSTTETTEAEVTTSTTQELRTISIAMSPFQDVTSIHVGIEEGFFAEEGIELVIENAGSWTASNELLVGGNIDLGTVADADIVAQNAQGAETTLAFPLYVFGGSALMYMPDRHPDWRTYEEFFAETNDVTEALRLTFEQLGDALIAIPSNDPTTEDMIRGAGLDTDDFDFLIMEEIDQPPALLNGSIDISRGGIPQRLAVEKEGAATLVDQRVLPKTLIHAGYGARRTWLEENFDLALAFQRALFKTQRFIVDNPDVSFPIISSALADQGVDLAPEEIQAVWNVMEFFPNTIDEYLGDYLDPAGTFFWETRFEAVVDGYKEDGTIPDDFGVLLEDMYYAKRIVEALP